MPAKKFGAIIRKTICYVFNTLLLLTENTALPDFGQPKYGSYVFFRENAAETALFRAAQETTGLLLSDPGRRRLTCFHELKMLPFHGFRRNGSHQQYQAEQGT